MQNQKKKRCKITPKKSIYTNLTIRTKTIRRQNISDMASSKYKSGLYAPPIYLKTCKESRHSETHMLYLILKESKARVDVAI